MIAVAAALLLSADPHPELVHVHRFPPLENCSGQIYWILRRGYCQNQMLIDTNRANYWRREMPRADLFAHRCSRIAVARVSRR